MVEQVYRGREPKASPPWQCLSHHFGEFLEAYKERFQPRYGFLRPIIPEVVEKFLECGDLARGFARIRCDHCKEDRLLAFSCKGRWFCPSCHQKKVRLFGALLAESILYPVPHRHYRVSTDDQMFFTLSVINVGRVFPWGELLAQTSEAFSKLSMSLKRYRTLRPSLRG